MLYKMFLMGAFLDQNTDIPFQSTFDCLLFFDNSGQFSYLFLIKIVHTGLSGLQLAYSLQQLFLILILI